MIAGLVVRSMSIGTRANLVGLAARAASSYEKQPVTRSFSATSGQTLFHGGSRQTQVLEHRILSKPTIR